MAERAIDPRLQELRDKGITLYSISRIDSINNCLCGAYKTYDKHERGRDNAYSSLGTKVHDTLEMITCGEKTELDLEPAVMEELENIELMGLEFPKDRNGGDSIKQGWVDDMLHFSRTYKAPRGNFDTEQLFIYKTKNGNYLMGYIDLIRKNKDGSVDIYDYKTSSMYVGSAVKEHSRQLLLYAMGLRQLGFNVRSTSWIFLKYAEVKFMGRKTSKSKSKTEMSKVIERKKIASEMRKYVEQDMRDLNYDELEIEMAINDFLETNMFSSLPEDISCNYKMLPYVMKCDLTDDAIEECEHYIDSTIEMWESMDHGDESQFLPREFTKTQKNGKVVSDIFFCTSLCGHFPTCSYIHDYLDTLNKDDDDEEDLF